MATLLTRYYLNKNVFIQKKKKVSEHNGVDITPYSIYIDLPTDG